MASFMELAPELILKITEFMFFGDIKRLRQTSSSMAALLEPLVLHTVALNIQEDLFWPTFSRAKRLASSCVIPSVRRLVIRGGKTFTPNRSESDKKLISNNLQTSFETLPAVESVTCLQWVDDGPWRSEAFMGALARLPRLQNISMCADRVHHGMPLHLLSNIRDLSFSVDSYATAEARSSTTESLVRLLARSPNLTHLAIKWENPVKEDLRHSLHEVFRLCSREDPIPKPRRLSLTGCFVRLDSTTLPHLRRLTSLHLVNVFGREPNRSESNEDGVSSSVEDIWADIVSSDIFLKEITVDEIPSTFLNYLESYNDLEVLTLCVDDFHDKETSDQAALRFFEKSLTSHIHTLNSLVIKANHDSHWCYGNHNHQAISQCSHLKHLRLSVSYSRLLKVNSPEDAILQLLDMVALCLKDLRTLTISASTAITRGSHFGVVVKKRVRVGTAIGDRVLAYTAPPTCRQVLPIVHVKFQVYLPVRTDEGTCYYVEEH